MKRGHSLLEMVVAAGILALALPLILNLLPTSFFALRKAENIQIATSLAIYQLDEARYLTPRLGAEVETVAVGGHDYQVAREFYRVDTLRWDVLVVCTSQQLAPVRLATRVIREEP